MHDHLKTESGERARDGLIDGHSLEQRRRFLSREHSFELTVVAGQRQRRAIELHQPADLADRDARHFDHVETRRRLAGDLVEQPGLAGPQRERGEQAGVVDRRRRLFAETARQLDLGGGEATLLRGCGSGP